MIDIKRAQRAALTFTEIMVCVLIIGIGIIPALIVFSRGNEGTMMTRNEILAHAFACELIDYTHALGYENLPDKELSGTKLPVITVGNAKLEIDPKFERRWFIIPAIPSEIDKGWPYQYKIIKVEIKWNSGEIPQKYVLTSMVFNGGPISN